MTCYETNNIFNNEIVAYHTAGSKFHVNEGVQSDMFSKKYVQFALIDIYSFVLNT